MSSIIQNTLLNSLIQFFSLGQDTELRVISEATIYSESYTIYQILHDLDGGPFPAYGNKAFAKGRVGVALKIGDHEFSFLRRRHSLADHKPDTAEFIYLDKNDIPLPEGAQYDFELQANDAQFSEYAYKYRYRFNEDLEASFGLGFVYANNLVKGYLSGIVNSGNVIGSLDYSWDAELDYHYREEYLLGRPSIDPPRGYGFTSYLSMIWGFAPSWTAAIEIDDLYSLIFWDAAPRTQAVSKVDESLELRDPAISGTFGYSSVTQQLPLHMKVKLEHQFSDNVGIYGLTETLFGQEFNTLGLNINHTLGSFGLYSVLETSAYGFNLETKFLTFAAQTDSLSKYRAKHAAFSLGLHLPF